jgi:hypothetical protein
MPSPLHESLLHAAPAGSRQQGPRSRWAYSSAGMLLVSVFLLYHLSVLMVWNGPGKDLAQPFQASFLEQVHAHAYFRGTRNDQSWAMFAPNPDRTNTFVKVFVTDEHNVNTDACPGSCVPAFCGDGYWHIGVEQCDDGDQDPNNGCDNECMGNCGGAVLLHNNWNGWSYYKVPVMGTLTDANILSACQFCGMQVPCQSTPGCNYNDNICTQTNNENSCGNPMLGLSHQLCGNGVSPSQCAALWGVYQYMGNSWIGGCGAEQNVWCSVGNDVMNKNALCVIQ